MAKGKKKKGKNLILLLILLVLLIVGYFVYEKVAVDSDSTEDTDEVTTEVLNIAEDNIETLYYKNEKAELTLKKNIDGEWTDSANEEIPLSTALTNYMSQEVSEVSATKIITENAEDLKEFGLIDPSLTVIATEYDGTAHTLKVGIKSPLGDGYYATVDDGSVVYLVDTDVYNKFNYGVSDLIYVADAPSITADYITHLLVESKDAGNVEFAYYETNPYDLSGSYTSNWAMLQGYDAPKAADATAVTTLLENYTSLLYKNCVDYDCKNFSQYGLDDPMATVTVDYYEVVPDDSETTSSNATSDGTSEDSTTATKNVDHTYTLQIGDFDEENSVYYVRDITGTSVYTMSKDTVDAMITVNKFECVSKYIQLINVYTINSVKMTTKDGQSRILSINSVTTKDADGNETKEDTFYLDGDEYDEDTARDLYQVIISPKYTVELPEDYTSSGADADITFVFDRIDDDDLVIKYVPYGNSLYVVDINGEEYFMADERDLKSVVDQVMAADVTIMNED